MSAKRAAGKQLTHDNWDDEDAPEEAGVFKQVCYYKCNVCKVHWFCSDIQLLPVTTSVTLFLVCFTLPLR